MADDFLALDLGKLNVVQAASPVKNVDFIPGLHPKDGGDMLDVIPSYDNLFLMKIFRRPTEPVHDIPLRGQGGNFQQVRKTFENIVGRDPILKWSAVSI